MRAHLADDHAFDRADIRDGRAGREMRRDLLRHVAARADRNTHNDEVGAFDRGGIGLDDLIGNPELCDALARRAANAPSR